MTAKSIAVPTQTYLLIMPLLLILFSLLDAQFTLICIRRGGYELNPLMNLALQQSEGAFLTVKMVLTIIPAIILAFLSRSSLAFYGLFLVNILYLGIVYYHLIHLI
jgi:hypothetical protein